MIKLIKNLLFLSCILCLTPLAALPVTPTTFIVSKNFEIDANNRHELTQALEDKAAIESIERPDGWQVFIGGDAHEQSSMNLIILLHGLLKTNRGDIGFAKGTIVYGLYFSDKYAGTYGGGTPIEVTEMIREGLGNRYNESPDFFAKNPKFAAFILANQLFTGQLELQENILTGPQIKVKGQWQDWATIESQVPMDPTGRLIGVIFTPNGFVRAASGQTQNQGTQEPVKEQPKEQPRPEQPKEKPKVQEPKEQPKTEPLKEQPKEQPKQNIEPVKPEEIPSWLKDKLTRDFWEWPPEQQRGYLNEEIDRPLDSTEIPKWLKKPSNFDSWTPLQKRNFIEKESYKPLDPTEIPVWLKDRLPNGFSNRSPKAQRKYISRQNPPLTRTDLPDWLVKEIDDNSNNPEAPKTAITWDKFNSWRPDVQERKVGELVANHNTKEEKKALRQAKEEAEAKLKEAQKHRKITIATSYLPPEPLMEDITRNVDANHAEYAHKWNAPYKVYDKDLRSENVCHIGTRSIPCDEQWNKIAAIRSWLYDDHPPSEEWWSQALNSLTGYYVPKADAVEEWIIMIDESMPVTNMCLDPNELIDLVRQGPAGSESMKNSSVVVVHNSLDQSKTAILPYVIMVRKGDDSRQFFEQLWEKRRERGGPISKAFESVLRMYSMHANCISIIPAKIERSRTPISIGSLNREPCYEVKAPDGSIQKVTFQDSEGQWRPGDWIGGPVGVPLLGWKCSDKTQRVQGEEALLRYDIIMPMLEQVKKDCPVKK